ncbi:MAG: Crp/Fnr family transcriptional regulator [Rhodospirillales bacterium]
MTRSNRVEQLTTALQQREAETTVADQRRPRTVAELPKISRESLLAECRSGSVPTGQTIYRQGAAHTSSCIVMKGLVRTHYTAATGREITLAYWSEGDLIGGPNFLGGGYHIWNATAATPCRLLLIGDRELRQLAERDPEILRWLTDTLSFKLKWLSILFQIHGTESVRQRLAKLLAMLCEIYGEPDGAGITIRHRISQGDLATLAGASRQWTNRALGEFKREGLLEISKRRITVLDLERLSAISSEEAQLFV